MDIVKIKKYKPYVRRYIDGLIDLDNYVSPFTLQQESYDLEPVDEQIIRNMLKS